MSFLSFHCLISLSLLSYIWLLINLRIICVYEYISLNCFFLRYFIHNYHYNRRKIRRVNKLRRKKNKFYSSHVLFKNVNAISQHNKDYYKLLFPLDLNNELTIKIE